MTPRHPPLLVVEGSRAQLDPEFFWERERALFGAPQLRSLAMHVSASMELLERCAEPVPTALQSFLISLPPCAPCAEPRPQGARQTRWAAAPGGVGN